MVEKRELPNIDILAEDNIRILELPKARLPIPLVILLVGLPSSGKSELVKELSQKFPLAILSEENMLKFLAPNISFFERSEEKILSLVTRTMEKLIVRRISSVFDHSIKKREYRDYIRRRIESLGGKSVLIHINIPKEDAYKQVSKSNFEVTRGDKKGVIINKDLFEYEVASTQIPFQGEHHLIHKPQNPDSVNVIVEQISKISGLVRV